MKGLPYVLLRVFNTYYVTQKCIKNLKGKVVLKHCTIKMYWSVSVIVKFSARWRLVVSGTLQQLDPWEKSPQYPVDWSLVVSLLQLTGFLRL